MSNNLKCDLGADSLLFVIVELSCFMRQFDACSKALQYKKYVSKSNTLLYYSRVVAVGVDKFSAGFDYMRQETKPWES